MKTKFINFLQSNALNFVEHDSELSKSTNEKQKKEISDEEMEMFMEHLVEQGLLKKEEYEDKTLGNNEVIRRTNYKITIKPFLSRNKPSVFYAMEFPTNEFEEKCNKRYQFYKKLKQAIETKLKLKVVMLYDDKQSGNLNTRIKNEIRTCSFFIADLTSENHFNPNVMYEIGMAEGFNKEIFQIIDEEKWEQIIKIKKLPFDISTHSTIKYSLDETKWESNANEIIKSIKASLTK